MADLTLLPPGPLDQKPWDLHIAPLNNELWQRFNWFKDLCRERFGIEQYVLSGVRTYAEQIQLRRQNCGSSQYAIYNMPPSQCHPATAIPGTSNHEVKNQFVGGTAIDCGFGYNDVRGAMRATATECGLFYTVKTEDWHVEIDPHNRTKIPQKYIDGTATPPPLPKEEDMGRMSMVERDDGVQFQAIIRKNGAFEYRFTDPKGEAGTPKPLINDNAWIGVHANGGPVIPFAFDTVTAYVFDHRFHIEVRSDQTAALVGQKGYGLPFKFDGTLYPSKL